VNEIIYIGVGSNIEPEINLIKAFDMLCRRIRIEAVSTCYRSTALDRPEQSDYINCVWQGVTDLDAESVKYSILRGIESALGRIRTADAYASREIDLDLLLYGDRCIRSPRITLPDPDITSRAFIAIPLLELAPEIIIPGMHQPLAAMEISQQKENLQTMNGLTEQLKERIKHEH